MGGFVIALGQYKVSQARLRDKLEEYAEITKQEFRNIDSFLIDYNENLYFRLHRRISFMKQEAYEKLFN